MRRITGDYTYTTNYFLSFILARVAVEKVAGQL